MKLLVTRRYFRLLRLPRFFITPDTANCVEIPHRKAAMILLALTALWLGSGVLGYRATRWVLRRRSGMWTKRDRVLFGLMALCGPLLLLGALPDLWDLCPLRQRLSKWMDGPSRW